MAAIRLAQAADIQAVCRIYAHDVQTSAATFEIDAPEEKEMERRRPSVASSGLPYLVIQQDSAIVGYAYAGQYRPRHAYPFTVEDSISIDADATGQGLGRLLLAELIKHCEQAGSRQMIAVVADSANVGSVGAKFGAWYDTALMQRALGPPAP
ncbi:MAG TPA: GNAT family N-acetyltransferase [Bryobacteraceae bacterium]|nr:GNAT family N-acetyltransferase [Bryobacteraceae bacterium]